MPIKQILKQIAEKDPSFTKVVIDDATFSDQDLPLLKPAILENPYIDSIRFKNHCLTKNSYEELLELIESNPNIIAFTVRYCNTPLGVGEPMFSRAIREYLAEHQENKKKQAEILTSFNKAKENDREYVPQDVPTDKLLSNGPTTRNGRH